MVEKLSQDMKEQLKQFFFTQRSNGQ